MKSIPIILSLACYSCFFVADVQAKRQDAPSGGSHKFGREDFLMMNLNRGQDSTGTHIALAQKQTKQMVKDLDRSLRQLEQVDREFAKAKGHPDNHYLTPAKERLEQALRTAQKLETELESSKEELRDAVQHALIMAQ
ncbi:MAG: hypothetical protein K2W82_03605 [Candidatus Obscuribacterales bacterium]|nr:hypothetical protein [Candidatus Obscuribacterales bacterium]